MTNGYYYPDKKSRMKAQRLAKQKLIGVVMLLITAVIIWLASTGISVEDRDATAILVTLPLGVYLLLTKRIVIY